MNGSATVTGALGAGVLVTSATVTAGSYVAGSASAGLTAAGTNLATALALSCQLCEVTTAASGTGVVLPSGAPTGTVGIRIMNRGASSLTVYAPSGFTVEGSASVTIAAGADSTLYHVASTDWRT